MNEDQTKHVTLAMLKDNIREMNTLVAIKAVAATSGITMYKFVSGTPVEPDHKFIAIEGKDIGGGPTKQKALRNLEEEKKAASTGPHYDGLELPDATRIIRGNKLTLKPERAEEEGYDVSHYVKTSLR